MYLKDLEAAKEQLVRALNFHKNDQSFLTLGKILLMQGDITGAIDIYKQGVHAFPENPDLCISLGLLYLQTGAHAAAFEQLGTAMAFEPRNTKAVLAAGSVAQVRASFLRELSAKLFSYFVKLNSLSSETLG